MRQRLSLATALLGDPRVLVLDEPANGLDPQGIRWLRDFLRDRRDEGRSVLVSSHVLAEVAQVVDEVLVLHRGRLVGERRHRDRWPAAGMACGASLDGLRDGAGHGGRRAGPAPRHLNRRPDHASPAVALRWRHAGDNASRPPASMAGLRA